MLYIQNATVFYAFQDLLILYIGIFHTEEAVLMFQRMSNKMFTWNQVANNFRIAIYS